MAEATTDRVLEKSFDEANKPKFQDLTADQTVQSFAKLAQQQSRPPNPLARPRPRPRKRKRDIFD